MTAASASMHQTGVALAMMRVPGSGRFGAGTTVRPDRGTDHLVTEGPFSFTRNPLYLAGTILVLGIGLVSGIVWFLLLAVLAAFAVQKLAIEREERHLQARFGKTYADYAGRVRRWI